MCKALDNSVKNPENLNLTSAKLRRLRQVLKKDRVRVKYLTKPGGDLNRKRRIVKQSGEGIGLLLGVLAPAVIELVRNLIRKKKR